MRPNPNIAPVEPRSAWEIIDVAEGNNDPSSGATPTRGRFANAFGCLSVIAGAAILIALIV